ncbi:MAG: TldD/PmbA family protein [Methanotrichaceae archaeon]|nr:TldD/PmbA family protein [Methanotrichaceae archaeon]
MMTILDTSDNLLEFSHKLLNLALNEGAEEAEVFGFAGRLINVTLRKDKVELSSESFHKGLGLRAVVRGAVGFSSTSDFSRLSLIVDNAIQSARARGGDESWKSFVLPEKILHPDNLFDPALDRIEPEQCLDLAAGLLMGCCDVKGAKPVSGGVTCSSIMETVVNSHEVELAEPSTIMYASLEAIAKGSDVATGSEFHNSRLLKSDLQDVGRSAALLAQDSLKGSTIESGRFEVLLKPLAFTELLEHTFIPSLSADNVQKGRSSLSKHMGETIASENLIITDNGLLSEGIGSSAFDGEGTPSKITQLIDFGVLKGFLYDNYTAGKVGEKSTGNAVRSSYSEIPRVSISNLVVNSKESRNLNDDVEGVLVNDLIGAHTANPISGDFSVEARNSFCLKPNKKPIPIKSMMLVGNIFELLKDIELDKDMRPVGNVIAPTVKVKVKIVG